ncbi:SDR family NAD(P)-dependent oxidoreductase [Geobacillus sp. FSL W8-0032]|uniref:SDR family NAD(P)-dependent oxidoreductase n=1 Tax=Geobacillus icigianus TaxID=1430331 RepID=A0ABU6BI87_9BACL|nr:SDR family NAD(P)-dependent oxidoreductase [Geobacillus icigianus]MEB3751616.1 hypothetical protein [Geobacillus icigianus]
MIYAIGFPNFQGITSIETDNLEETEKVVQEIRKNGGRAELFQADVSKETEAEALIDFTCDKSGRIDILVNNAGVTKDGLLINMSVDDWNYVI